jgi:CHAT domain-containing protein
VIAGLWDVDDRSTARLMDQLYGGLQAGHTPARSLRESKLALIREGGQLAGPYYWGPFQLYTTSP